MTRQNSMCRFFRSQSKTTYYAKQNCRELTTSFRGEYFRLRQITDGPVNIAVYYMTLTAQYFSTTGKLRQSVPIVERQFN